ncbi:transcription antitermination factor NusB [Parachlamydia sp. AcF125]|uniref:transcription antitermination factor NusB n=1 Tax=Parachlamydia sp. AcF125 TaxID=2795736 RepID=UPI001BC91187|nr:transcription antitermination factor NusB [Parachlamydia sp. AcF125]MBS4167860.1 Ribosomal RNA small subunit methyltransferase B [Parachlamydia sp. AcF125]
MSQTNPREAAFLAVYAFLKEGKFLAESLEEWKQRESPSPLDFAFAQDVAYGSVRMALTLDFTAKSMAKRQTLSLKIKEKALLRTALFQAAFQTTTPLYAIGHESVDLAKKYCHATFVSFLNALLRKAEKGLPPIPQENTPQDLSIRYSYPLPLVEAFLANFGLDTCKQILELGNRPSTTMVRLRPQTSLTHNEQDKLTRVPQLPPPLAFIKEASDIPLFARSPHFYIQNGTPYLLMEHLRQGAPPPGTILDLCASPGGKLLLAHDFYPSAPLFANDVSLPKIRTLQENCQKYQLEATLTCTKGEFYIANQRFDLIIVDAPCSNTGVLNKRPEARWRFSDQVLKQLEDTQLRLLSHAHTLLSEQGEIWYMTCSILSQENQKLVQKISRQCGLFMRTSHTILPNTLGLDGGFACALRLS